MGLFKSLLLATLSIVAVLMSTVPPDVDAQQPASVPSSSPQCPPQNQLLPEAVVILNTGSTNAPCYWIYVLPSGDATYETAQKHGSGKLPIHLREKFFHDLKLAQPLSKLRTQKPCLKSVFFGTSTLIKLGQEESPDVSCPGSGKAVALFRDATAITQQLGVL